MRIKTVTKTFKAHCEVIYLCEHCGHKEKGLAFYTANFHENKLPFMQCTACKKTRREMDAKA